MAPGHSAADFGPADRKRLEAAGIPLDEARRQAALLAAPPPALRLARPCRVGDGIRRLDPGELDRYEARGAASLGRVRAAKFVPASGAATRLFKDLLAAIEAPEGLPPAPAADLLTSADRLPFFGEWAAALGAADARAFALVLARGRWREALRALLLEPGLGYARLPKAFLPFHRVGARSRTALEEHWREAGLLGLKRLCFTLSTEHLAGFEVLVDSLRSLPAGEAPPALELAHGTQAPSTDTLAGDGKGGLFRDADGNLVLRPGGHGALLPNLQALAGDVDVALLRNIDNIAHPRLWEGQLRARRVLLGLLDEAVEREGGRPVRVAGVVANTGEPGGGPFWVEGLDEPQIVESAQVDLGDPGQKALFAAATHFNPVDLACRLTDAGGRPFALDRYSDPSAVFLSHKSHLGRPLLALERPGLWNGAMAHWRTLFVELPLETFNPVKTVSDLLKPAHQERPA